MTWTQKKPTEPGYYWVREEDHSLPLLPGVVRMEEIVWEDEDVWVQRLDEYGFADGSGHYENTGRQRLCVIGDGDGIPNVPVSDWEEGVYWYGPVTPPRFQKKEKK